MFAFLKKKTQYRKIRKFPCKCCGCLTLLTGPGNYDVCPVCFWEDDPTQNEHEDFSGGANRVSLSQAKANYEEFGACEGRFMDKVRAPYIDEIPEE